MSREWTAITAMGAFAVAAWLIRPFAVWWAWNTVMPVLGVPSLTLWQAVVLTILARALHFPACPASAQRETPT